MKKLLSLLLTITLLFSALPMMATAEATSLTVYVTASRYGEFLQTTQEELAVMLPVTLEGEASYDLDDVFSAFHQEYAPPECGYASEEHPQLGLGLTKFWGDDSGNFGYWINNLMAMSLSDPVENNDAVTVAIYDYNFQSYTAFDITETAVSPGEPLPLTLSQSGYDAAWNQIFLPCEGAEILLNGESTGIFTDENGCAELTFDAAGTYLVSAQKEEVISEQPSLTLIPPHCMVTVAEPQWQTVIHNIAAKYSDETLASDGNMIWFLCDLAMYNEVYPENAVTLSETVKQACLDEIITDTKDSNSASVMAKSILALRAMGYDAKNITDANGQQFDLVARLTALVDANDSTVTNVYTLPFVLLALNQGENYATNAQIEALLQAAIESKASWQNDTWGIDAMTFMLPALAPYTATNTDIAAAVTETVPMITAAQTETGAIGNAASTGLALAALSAVGTDIATVITNEQTPIDGLLTYLNESSDGFLPSTNSFSTEQGFRGLVSWQFKEIFPNRNVYDFSGYPMNPAVATLTATPTPEPTIAPTPTPTAAPVYSGGGSYVPKKDDEEEKKEEPKEENKTNNKTTVILENKNPDVKIPQAKTEKTFKDISGHKYQAQIEALASRGIINGKTATDYEPSATLTRAELSALIARALGLTKKAEIGFRDVTETDWYYDAVSTAYHYGIIKGVSETEFNPNGTLTRQEAAVMLARAAALCGLQLTEQSSSLGGFSDHERVAAWAKEAFQFCYGAEILESGTSEIKPQVQVSRGDIAFFLYNLLEQSLTTEDAIAYEK